MSIENIENWYAYYPQNTDWIGLSIYENGGNQGKDIAVYPFISSADTYSFPYKKVTDSLL